MARTKHTIVEEIRLTGGPEIEAEFNKLGEAGKRAFAALKAEADKFGETNPIEKWAARETRAILRLVGEAKKVGKAYKELGSATVTFGRNVAYLTAAITGATVGFVAFVKGAADAADAQSKAAQATGLAIDQYAKLQFAFEQGNVGADLFGAGMKKLNTNIDQASKGVGAGAKLFKQLGISVKDVAGNLKPTDDILKELAAKFQALPDGPTKSALAIQLFGKSGAAMIPVLNEGAAAMQKLEDQAVKLGLVFTDTEAKIGDEFGDSVDQLGRSATALSQHLALLFAPSLTETFQAITDLIGENRESIMAFGQVLANQVSPILKDFILILQGRDTEVVNQNLLGIRDTIVSIGQAMAIVGSIITAVFNGLADIIRPFVDIFNAIFGTKITAEAALLSTIVFALTGAFKVLGLGIKAVALTWGLLVKSFGTFAPIIAAVFVGILGVIAEVTFAIQAMGRAFSGIPAVFQSIVEPIVGIAGELAKFLTDIWTGLTTETGTLFSDLGAAIIGTFTQVGDFIKGLVDDVLEWINSVIDLAKKAIETVANALGGGGGEEKPEGGGPGFAGGGRVRGPGTGTSDSILARLSDGEYVVKAKAVAKYGPAFLNALNNMRLPKRMAFAAGGLVSAARVSMPRLPAFAAGGPVGRPLSLTIGMDTFTGLIAPDTVADKLVRYASGRSVRSAGPRPSWSH